MPFQSHAVIVKVHYFVLAVLVQDGVPVLVGEGCLYLKCVSTVPKGCPCLKCNSEYSVLESLNYAYTVDLQIHYNGSLFFKLPVCGVGFRRL